MTLIGELEHNICEYGDCTIELQPYNNNEVYAVRFIVNDEGLLDVHAFEDKYDKEYWIKDEDGNTVTNPKAKITSSRYVQTFTKKEELLTVLASFTCKMIIGETVCVKKLEGHPQASTKKSVELIHLITSSMLNISNKDLTGFLTMDSEEIIKYLMRKVMMTKYGYVNPGTLDSKCEGVINRYNNMIELHNEAFENNNNEAMKIWYQLQNDESMNSFDVPKQSSNKVQNNGFHVVK